MRIVIFIDWFAPAYKAGGPIQSIVNLVNQPIEGVEYKIICSNKDLDGKPVQGVHFDKWVQFNAYTQVWYNTRNRAILSLLQNVRKWNVDILFINGVYSFYYNILPIVFGKAGKKIISARGMLNAGALTQKSFKKKVYLQVWKWLRIHKKHVFHATNAEEKRFIQAIFGKQTKIHVVPNLPRKLQLSPGLDKKVNSLKLISIGLISPMKNYFEVLKLLSKCQANIHYTIYGPIKDKIYWQQCREQIKNLPENVMVDYKGDLPSFKVQEALNGAHVFILPSKSENFGHAIFEALTAGKPVITSHNTPWNNLNEAKAGFNVSVENYDELSTAINFFAKADNNLLSEWSSGAKFYAEKTLNIDHIKEQYKEMFSGRS